MGETTADGRFTLLPVVCLGNCDHAPTMIVGGELYHDLTPEQVDEILDGNVAGQRPQALDDDAAKRGGTNPTAAASEGPTASATEGPTASATESPTASATEGPAASATEEGGDDG
jgi:(2Fe-2S) ferredoxin